MPIATSSEIAAAIGQVVGTAPRPIHLHEPHFGGNEQAYVAECIATGWVSSVGSYVDRFERDLAALCGARHAAAMVNGTCALHAALLIVGVRPGDEVLIPALTFVATANAVVHAGAVPHFVDCEDVSLGMDPVALRQHLEHTARREGGQAVNRLTGRPIRAIMPVHIFGHPCRLDEIAAVAQEWGLALLEDATEALGSIRQGKPVGSTYTAVLSFNGNKTVTTGGGGAVVTGDPELHSRLKHLTTTGKKSHPWAFVHDQVAYNYRLPNINAALGCAQLEQAPRFLAAKRALAARYMEVFATVPGLRVLPSPPGTLSNFWLVALVAQDPPAGWLERTLQDLHDVGLRCRPIWEPLHRLPMYREAPRAPLPITESIAARVINLPSSAVLGFPLLDGGALA